MKRKEIKWQQEGKDTMAGPLVEVTDVEILEIYLEEEQPGVYLEGEVIEEIRNRVEKMIVQEAEAIKSVWQELYENVCAASGAFAKWGTAVVAQIEAKHELETALRWASCYYRPAFNRYRNTKKKRIRKKYAKRILAWYREEVL